MPHVHRFYVPQESVSAAEIALPLEESHHALHVVRVQQGERVVLFDGEGTELDGEVSRATRREVFVAVRKTRRIPEPATGLTLLQAWLHQERSIEYLIRRCTELGVTRFRFFRGGHSERAPRLTPKLTRVAIEACKQCGRAWLPSFEVAPDLRAAIEGIEGGLLILTQHLDPVPLRQAVQAREATVIIGPEGDFTPEELGAAERRGAVPISLGGATYRAEVAATLAATLILYELGEVGPRGA